MSARIIATAAFAIFPMLAFNICAEEALKPSIGDHKAVDSSVADVANAGRIRVRDDCVVWQLWNPLEQYEWIWQLQPFPGGDSASGE